MGFTGGTRQCSRLHGEYMSMSVVSVVVVGERVISGSSSGSGSSSSSSSSSSSRSVSVVVGECDGEGVSDDGSSLRPRPRPRPGDFFVAFFGMTVMLTLRCLVRL